MIMLYAYELLGASANACSYIYSWSACQDADRGRILRAFYINCVDMGEQGMALTEISAVGLAVVGLLI